MTHTITFPQNKAEAEACDKTLQATLAAAVGCTESLEKTAFHFMKFNVISQRHRIIENKLIITHAYLDNARYFFCSVNQKNFAINEFSTFIW